MSHLPDARSSIVLQRSPDVNRLAGHRIFVFPCRRFDRGLGSTGCWPHWRPSLGRKEGPLYSEGVPAGFP